MLEDYADLAEGLLALYAVTGDARRLHLAGELLEVVLTRFGDGSGGFYDTADDRGDPRLAAMRRPQDPTDNATPSGQAAAAGALLGYAAYTGSARHREAAEQALAVYTPSLRSTRGSPGGASPWRRRWSTGRARWPSWAPPTTRRPRCCTRRRCGAPRPVRSWRWGTRVPGRAAYRCSRTVRCATGSRRPTCAGTSCATPRPPIRASWRPRSAPARDGPWGPPRSYRVRPLTDDDLAEIEGWRYEGPWSVYDSAGRLDPALGYWAVEGDDGRLAGFGCLGEDARVPGLPGAEGVVDVGVGMRPDLVGRGGGALFAAAFLEFAAERVAADRFRAVVKDWNERSVRLVERLGFVRPAPTRWCAARHRDLRGARAARPPRVNDPGANDVIG